MMTWNDFFNFSDDKPIEEAIQAIETLTKTYQKMIAAVEDSNARIAGDFNAVSQNAEELLKTVQKLNIGMEANQKILTQSANSSEELMKEYLSLKTVQQENQKQVTTLNDQLIKLNDTKEKLKKSSEAESGSYDDLKVRLAEAEKAYKAMGAATDSAVKQEQLDKVSALAAEYKTVNGALADAKKGAVAAAGSYNELASRVAQAKKQLKEMEGGLDGNSKEFKELQKFAKEGTQQLKDWDEAVGDNQRKVGDYAGELSKISPALGGVIGGLDGATASAKAFIATPIGAILAAIAIALGSLTAYFQGSIDGQDDLNKVLRVGEAIFETLMDVVEAFGEILFDAITKPKEAWEGFMKLIEPLGEMMTKAFEDPIQAIKNLGSALYDNVISRGEGVINFFKSNWKILSSGFTEGYEDLGNSVIQMTTGVKDGINKIADAAKPLIEELERRAALALKIAELENKLRKDRIADIIDDAKTELEVAKLLVEAKDKLRFSEEERFNKLRKANALLEEQLEGDLELIRDEIRLQQMIIEQTGETYEERQKLVELQAQEIELQSKFIQQRKRRQSEEIALIREIEKDMIDSRKRIQEAENALNTVRVNEIIRQNNQILAEEQSSLDQRLTAIQENEQAQLDLLGQEKDKQLEEIKEAGLARVSLSAEITDQIYSNEEISIQQRIELERQAKEELLQTDQAYLDQTLKVQEDFTNKSNALIESSNKLAEENVFKILQRDAEIFAAQYNTSINDQLKALNEAFASGDISSVKEFEQQKLAIQQQAQEESILSQIEYLKQRAALLEEGGKERVQTEEKISQLELRLSEQNAKERLKYEQDVQEAIKELKQTAFEGALTIIANLNEAEDMEREAKLQKLSEQQEAELLLAGDNEEAKSKIRNEFAAKEKKIQEEQAAANRKRAMFEKALAITQVAVNTALAVSKALASAPPPANFILAALVGAAGAIQVAAIASKPIPQFAVGTEDSPEGLAIVNELGPELIVDRHGKARIIGTDGPTLTYLEKGSQVFTAPETERILENENFANEVDILKNGVDTVIEVNQNDNNREVIDTINRRMLSLESTVRNKREVYLGFKNGEFEAIIKNGELRTRFLKEFFE